MTKVTQLMMFHLLYLPIPWNPKPCMQVWARPSSSSLFAWLRWWPAFCTSTARPNKRSPSRRRTIGTAWRWPTARSWTIRATGMAWMRPTVQKWTCRTQSGTAGRSTTSDSPTPSVCLSWSFCVIRQRKLCLIFSSQTSWPIATT